MSVRVGKSLVQVLYFLIGLLSGCSFHFKSEVLNLPTFIIE